jgi:hypothetical protein
MFTFMLIGLKYTQLNRNEIKKMIKASWFETLTDCNKLISIFRNNEGRYERPIHYKAL